MFTKQHVFWITALLLGIAGTIYVLNKTKHQQEQEERSTRFQKNIRTYIDPSKKSAVLSAPPTVDSTSGTISSTDSFQVDEHLAWDQFIDQLYLRLAALTEQQKACLYGQGYCPGAAVLAQRQAAVNEQMAQIAGNFKLDRFPAYRAIRLLEEQFTKEQPDPSNLERLREVNFLRKQYIEQLKKTMQKEADQTPPS